jgi:hypothetical protein
MKSTFDEVTALTDPFCREQLNDEYTQLVREAAAALSRKRPSPLTRGRMDIWACGIVLAMGWVNFLQDRSSDPYMSTADVCGAFGVKESTASNKAALIRDTLNIRPFDSDWCLPSRLGTHPLAWMIQVNGLMVDARRMPREVQEIAFDKGFIPYIPAEEPNGE